MATVSSTGWGYLPSVIVIQIFSFLSLNDIISAASVCKSWRDCLFHPSLWRKTVFRLNSCDNVSRRNRSNEGALFLAKKCGRYVRNAVIELNSLNPRDSKECVDILEILAQNRNIKALSLRPSSSQLEWIDTESVEDSLPDLFARSLKSIIKNSRELNHISLGCVEELLENAESFLLLLGQQHAKSLQSLHLSSIKENPDYYALLDLPAHMFDPFCNLQELGIDYDYLCDQLLLVLSKSHKKPLARLNIHVHGIDAEHPDLTDSAWKQLSMHSPNLKVSLTLLHSYDLSPVLCTILYPSMPLAHLRSYFSPGLDGNFLDLLAVLNNTTLQSVVLVESLSEDLTPAETFLTVEEDPLVMLAWRCKKLSHLTVIGYDIFNTSLIAIARLRGAQLKELKVPSCCISISSLDEEVPVHLDSAPEDTRSNLLEEISSRLGLRWVPVDLDDIPRPVVDVNMDADGTYLKVLLQDQSW